MYRELVPLAVGVAAALPLTLFLGAPLFFLTGQFVGRFGYEVVILKFALSVFLVFFWIVYGCVAIGLRRKHGLPAIQFSLRRLMLCVALLAAASYLFWIPTVKSWPPVAPDPGAPAGVREYGWPLICNSVTVLASGGEAPSFHIGAAVFDAIFIALLAFFVLSVRKPWGEGLDAAGVAHADQDPTASPPPVPPTPSVRS